MPAPTRPQIEAVVTQPTYTVETWNGSAWVALANADVKDASGLVDVGTGSSGLDFGASAQPKGTLVLERTATTAALAWQRLKVRASFGFATSTLSPRITGIVTDRERAYGATDEDVITLQVAGFDELIRTTAVYSPAFYRRLPFTPTSISSVEDPTNVAYAGGLGNYILWTAGGRPLEQAGTYPTATFYYTCASALIAPEWSWIAGEDAWAELDRLCRSCGGQVVQQPDGTIAYVNPLAPTTGSYTLTEATFQSARERGSTKDYVTAARCSYSGRRLQPQQVVYEDTTPRLVPASSTVNLTLDMERPVYSYATKSAGVDTLPDDAYTAMDLNTYSVGYPNVYARFVSSAAGRAVVQLVNNLTTPVVFTRLGLRGQPIAVVETGQETYGSGSPERAIADQGGIYVQSRAHAARLARLYVDVYGQVRPAIELSGMGYDPDRTLGEVLPTTLATWGITAQPYRVTSINAQQTGATMALTVVPITSIPTTSDLFMVGTTYAGADVRQLGW